MYPYYRTFQYFNQYVLAVKINSPKSMIKKVLAALHASTYVQGTCYTKTFTIDHLKTVRIIYYELFLKLIKIIIERHDKIKRA